MKFEILKSFLFAFSHWHERISVKTHNIENRFVIGPESVLFCRLVRALFSPDILQPVAAKGIIFIMMKLPEDARDLNTAQFVIERATHS